MSKTLLAVVLTVGWLHPAFAAGAHCDEDIKAVDGALATAKLSDSDAAKVKSSRAKADELHKAKDYEACEAALDDAKKVLGIVDKHDK